MVHGGDRTGSGRQPAPSLVGQLPQLSLPGCSSVTGTPKGRPVSGGLYHTALKELVLSAEDLWAQVAFSFWQV